jgi:hypothetical protein
MKNFGVQYIYCIRAEVEAGTGAGTALKVLPGSRIRIKIMQLRNNDKEDTFSGFQHYLSSGDNL